MARIAVLGGSLAGQAAAARLAKVGHTVTLHGDLTPDAATAAHLDGPLPFPAPWRDFFAKTGRPAAGALGLHGLELVPDTGPWPGDRAAQWYLLREVHGEDVAARWRDLLDHHDDVWLALRPLGLEAELTPDALARATILHPKTSVEDVARRFDDVPDLAARLRRVADAAGATPADAPAWLISRLAVERTFGLWQLVDAAGPVPTTRLLDVVAERVRAVGVRVAPADEPADADLTIDARPTEARWRRPGWRTPTFTRQLLGRPPLRSPGAPTHLHASASSPGGAEPWAQLLTGALAAYAAHEILTGADIRPTNRALVKHAPR